MAYYQILRSIYHTLIPGKLRRLSYDRRYPFHYVVDPIKAVMRLRASNDEFYDKSYFVDIIEPLMSASADIMAETIFNEFHPNLVVDVGCGAGGLLLALKRLGVEVIGFEGSTPAIEIARAKGLEVHQLDLRQPVDQLEVHRSDVVISTEVAEHLRERFADGFVEYLCRTANTVVMTAARPGQEGHDHVNLQPKDYWIAKFQTRSFVYERDKVLRLSRQWKEAQTATCYHANLMVFSKR